ncbi:MAG TPA: hypothetical protein EYN73_00690 [Chromatiaceae bacterium]|nr:hypothetical protein [Chromatiaceae bacterium]
MIDPFSSTTHYTQAFIDGLMALLDHHELGTWILVCANASSDGAMFKQFRPALQRRFAELTADNDLSASQEDLQVFKQLQKIGLDSIHPTKHHELHPWTIQFNQLRSLKPLRIGQASNTDLHTAFDANGFNFNKPFMAKECFWRGELEGRHVDLFYNKYPFANLHGLLVPDRGDNKPQFLTEADHHFVAGLSCALDKSISGTGFGYNSIGACASINHLHFQMFTKDDRFPINHDQWQHNGGSIAYPIPCHRFTQADAAWRFIESVHNDRQPYNVLYQADVITVFTRKAQSTTSGPDWSSGFTWHELAGSIVCFDQHAYQTLSAADIKQELGKLACD